jgi:hypothetical protein
MAEIEKVISDLEKQIEAINIKNFIKTYVPPANKNQLFIDKLEFYMFLTYPLTQEYEVNKILYGGVSDNPSSINFVSDQLNPTCSSLWYMAFDLVDKKYPNQFYHELDKIDNPKKVITLFRKSPGKCIISGKIHEKENSYMRISETKCSYKVSVGCNRKCTFSRGGQLKGIGTIDKFEDSYGFYFSHRDKK